MFSELKARHQSHKQKQIYTKLFKKYGATVKSLHWNSQESQQRRFQMFCEMGSLKNKSILDVGCGFGDFFSFLKRNNIEVTYTGCDLVDAFILEAHKLHPEATFETRNILKKPYPNPFDQVFASGLFAFGNEAFFEKMIHTLWKHCSEGLCFNMHHSKSSEFFHLNEADILTKLKKLKPHAIWVKEDKEIKDSTYYLLKTPLQITGKN